MKNKKKTVILVVIAIFVLAAIGYGMKKSSQPDIIWEDSDKIGIVNFDLDGTQSKEMIIQSYYTDIKDFISVLDKESLKDYEYIRFVGNVKRENKIESTIKGNLTISYIKNAENIGILDVEDNMQDLFIPTPLQ